MLPFVPTAQPTRRAFSALVITSLLAAAAGLPTVASAQTASTVQVGQRVPALALKDQHDKPWQMDTDTRLLMFAASRQASNLVQEVLHKLPPDQLTRNNALYLADMGKMPGIITRTFALPALKKLPYPIGVSTDEATLAAWPRQGDAVTLIELDQHLVKRISYVSTEADLRAALDR
ncbi:hypothetical protein [Rhodoferax fermentans]|uniref:FAD/FMN-containing dehydrogenase n=1 Tax=Rhodoferax fermentans TaxID=28066 RepID=A0A1T1AW14_RHOFE|nr:hypothetical protein [Rhodoferax fermentans]MBK1685841.1 hypothetical protein [Rhodoferax fermentans]OOV08247.1 hypothetical protein RF819_17330 [Rhodoferax fermentans]